MATLSENLRTVILAADTSLDGRCHRDLVPQREAQKYPRVWYRRSSLTDDPDLDGTKGGLIEELYEVEVMSDDHVEANTVAEAIRTALHCKQGTFGEGTVKACFVSDVDDNYEIKGVGADDGIMVIGLQVRILHGT